ncbi:hypothetical protein JTF06_11025 [Desemzia sp. RIT804]|uniref:hypothetical protein n=1 Tax=Desemzia sp. RIT 804 TaxID=2810209 RepID=UPI00194DC011|nr:hypothetical protein [Desemzia sp. RIT 804]MBM6615422.1 hypothetical protein [Desemzia sp. RIT 804]
MLKTNARLLSKLGTACVLIYLVLFLSTGLDKMLAYSSPWVVFVVCVLLSFGGFVLSVLSIFGEASHFIPYFSAFLAFLLILFTVFVFLLPEAGIPPLIPLFFESSGV